MLNYWRIGCHALFFRNFRIRYSLTTYMDQVFRYGTGSINDLEQLLELSYLSYSQYRSALTPEHWEKLKAGLKDREKLSGLIQKSKVFTCKQGGQIIGMAYLVSSGNPTSIFDKEWCYIRMVGVHPDFRGNGIAKKLTQLCIAHAKASNEKILALHTSEYMDAARHIYEALGFQRLKELDTIFGKRYWLYTLSLQQ